MLRETARTTPTPKCARRPPRAWATSATPRRSRRAREEARATPSRACSSSPRRAWASSRTPKATAPLLALLQAQRQQGRVPAARGRACAGQHRQERGARRRRAKDPSAAVRLGVVLAYRELQRSPRIAQFLDDADAYIAREAAEAINDAPIEAALAAAGRRSSTSAPVERRAAVVERAINANYRLGGAEQRAGAGQLRDQRKAPPRACAPKRCCSSGCGARRRSATASSASTARCRRAMARPRRDALTRRAAEGARRRAGSRAARGARSHRRLCSCVKRRAALLAATVAQRRRRPKPCASARSRQLDAVRRRRRDARASTPRRNRSVAGPAPRGAADRRRGARPSARCPSSALSTSTAPKPNSGRRSRRWAARSARDAEAAGGARSISSPPARFSRARRSSSSRPWRRARRPAVKARWAKQQAAWAASGNALAPYSFALAGGNPRRGAGRFFENAVLPCARCHKVGGEGGEAGPDLSLIGKDKTQGVPARVHRQAERAHRAGLRHRDVASSRTARRRPARSRASRPRQIVLKRADGTTPTIDPKQVKQRTAAPSSHAGDLRAGADARSSCATSSRS